MSSALFLATVMHAACHWSGVAQQKQTALQSPTPKGKTHQSDVRDEAHSFIDAGHVDI